MKIEIPDRIKGRVVWCACHSFIGAAAAGITGWSLYVIARHYGVPKILAFGTAAVFDGAAMACLNLASQAVRERRSALGPLLATLGMASISVYLNRLHADLIHGGRGAFLLFAMPTVVLLILAGLSWSAQRARMRAQDGDVPATLPRLGFWGWLIATEESWKRTTTQVRAHVTSTDNPRTEPAPAKPRSATEALRAHFAGMHPVEAIRFAHSARPDAAPGELAAELALYGIHVSPVQVALVLGHQPPVTTVDRPDPVRTPPGAEPPAAGPAPLTSADRNPDRSGFRPELIKDAVQFVTAQGITDTAMATAEVSHLMGKQVREDTVRRYISDLTKQPKPPGAEQLPLGDGIDEGEGFYP
ncbi:DUF2637 domain-containing protein [Streptomyces aureoversilis]|uniref:DUF2637 domain-containing protein n=1 Tax=Streptomyces aureoversilis TaxID=67277 RepID=A0ABV9ZVR6_9ACTN